LTDRMPNTPRRRALGFLGERAPGCHDGRRCPVGSALGIKGGPRAARRAAAVAVRAWRRCAEVGAEGAAAAAEGESRAAAGP
jgi:hypothetical protein